MSESNILDITLEAIEEVDLESIVKKKIKPPKRYKVILRNDDYTTMEFVLYVLKNIFLKNESDAMNIMLEVHNKGQGICGVYSYEIAETKREKVMFEAKKKEHPLVCTIIPE